MKIAIDLDDTLSRVDRVSRPLGYIARKQLPFRLVDKNAQTLYRAYDWERQDVLQFLREGGISVFTEAEARPMARETLARFRAEGHTVVVLTARMKEMFQNPEKLSRDWLEKRKIPYDELVCEVEDKGVYCLEHSVDILIDNHIEHCLNAQKRGVCAILAVSKDTLARAGEVGFAGATWQQIGEQVDKIAHIRQMESLVSRAVVARKTERYDGWEIRSDEWTEPRANCIRAVEPSRLPLAYKLTFLEERARRMRTACRYYLSPLDFELSRTLRMRGYQAERNCAVMVLDNIQPLLKGEGVTVYTSFCEEWKESYLAVTERDNARDFTAYGGVTLYALVTCDGVPASVLTAVLDGDWLGVYDVHTAPLFRRKGFARRAMEAVLCEGKRLGAKHAYLQVRTANVPAESLYRSLGFTRSYEYRYVSKGLEE